MMLGRINLNPPVKYDPWKCDIHKKRIIFAPHFQVWSDSLLNRGAFLWVGDFILKMANKYRDEIHIVFKPHPLLRNALYNLPDWGKERADRYYSSWEELENTQIELGEYVDLFKTSDALIHNCGSFTAEYLYTGKPVLFITENLEEVKKNANDFGIKCIDNHYMAFSCDQVEKFILDVVINGFDPKKEERNRFRREHLIPPEGETAAGNMYQEILRRIKC